MVKEKSGIKESGPRLLPTFRLGADWPAQSFRCGSGSDGTACLLDLLAGSGADAFDLDGQFAAQITGAENLDGITDSIHETLLAKRSLIDHRAIFECIIETANIDHFIDVTELNVAETFLWKTAVEGHLTTFKARANTGTSAGLLTFVAFA